MSLTFEVRHGDCLELMRAMPDNSVDAVVTDPPYGLSFMGKKWDYDVPGVEVWAECLRVLKPGGHLLAFAGTRTQHRMAVRIEDAGFEIRDMIAWVYGSGFPKSLDVSKAIDKAAGAEREVVRSVFRGNSAGTSAGIMGQAVPRTDTITAPATAEAEQWDGWGTALKPSLEPVTVARKPLVGTVAENVLEHGTGAINVDGCRVATPDTVGASGRWGLTGAKGWNGSTTESRTQDTYEHNNGRWPANLIHDGSEEVLGCFPDTKGGTAVRRNGGQAPNPTSWDKPRIAMPDMGYGDTGSAARFFSCQKDDFPLLLSDAKAIFEAWKKSTANTVQGSLSRPRQYADIARDLVRLAEACGAVLQGPLLGGHFTSATESECERLCEIVITAILYIEQRSWLVSQHERHTLLGSLVSIAATNEQTGITTITVSHLTSDGYAESATFGIMRANTDRGVVASASRFTYCAKASKRDRDEGLEGFEAKPANSAYGDGLNTATKVRTEEQAESGVSRDLRRNIHSTVKPTALMRYLCRLVTPPGGTVLDPFTGSGSTGKGAKLEGFNFIGIEREAEYVEIARARIEGATPEAKADDAQLDLFSLNGSSQTFGG